MFTILNIRKMKYALILSSGTTMEFVRAYFGKLKAEEQSDVANYLLDRAEGILESERHKTIETFRQGFDDTTNIHRHRLYRQVGTGNYHLTSKQKREIDDKIENEAQDHARMEHSVEGIVLNSQSAYDKQKKNASEAKKAKQYWTEKYNQDSELGYKEFFFKPYQSKSDPIIRAATIVTAPIALTLFAIEQFLESVFFGLKYLCELDHLKEQTKQDAGEAFVGSLMSLLLAIASPVLNLSLIHI